MSLKDEDYQKVIEASGLTISKDELIKQYGKDKVEEAVKSYKVVSFLVEKAKRSAATVNVNGETISGAESSTSAESTTAQSSEAAK